MHMKTTSLVHNSTFLKKDVEILRKTMTQLPELHKERTRQKLLRKQTNDIDFYAITPKDQLPKSLQKMNFQTLNTKETNASSFVRIYDRHKQKLTNDEKAIRKVIREQDGHLMFLSEIYQSLDDNFEGNKETNDHKDGIVFTNVIQELDEWQKKAYKKKISQNFAFSILNNNAAERRVSKVLKMPNINEQAKRVSININSNHKKQFIVKKFKIGSDYKSEIQKNLQLIGLSHANQTNWLTKYALIENSSKLIKKQLEEMKEIIQKQIDEKMKKVFQSRKQHHRLYDEKLRLNLQEQEIEEQLTKQEGNILQFLTMSATNYSFHSQHQSTQPPKLKCVLADKKGESEKNQTKIVKIKKNIQFLEEEAMKNEEQLKNILTAQKAYYQISLKNGIDFRESGLVWIIKKLGITNTVEITSNLNTDLIISALLQNATGMGVQFPEYMDKKTKGYLLIKARNQQQLQLLITQKRNFVNQIGKQNKNANNTGIRRNQARKNSIKLQKNLSINCQNDHIKEVNSFDDTQIPKKYIRSAQKITALREQYFQNQNLLKMSQSRGGLRFGYHLEGMTGRQIYKLACTKIKLVDFSKLKKQKGLNQHDKIFEYQDILKHIEQLHMSMQDQDIQQENHLLSHYRDNKQLFFMQAAACFGAKRAYSLIIKNFSWKSHT